MLVFTLIYFAYLSFRMTPAISASISIWDGVGSDSEKIFLNFFGLRAFHEVWQDIIR